MQVIQPLKEEMERISKEKRDYVKQVAKLQEEFCEKEEDWEKLKITTAELQETISDMKETYEYTIRVSYTKLPRINFARLCKSQ